MLKKFLFVIIAAGVVATSYWLSDNYFAEDEAEANYRRSNEPVRVEAARAERRALRETIVYPGSIVADETVSIAPRISGIIRYIHVDFGDFVAKGAPLVAIDDAEFVERQKQAEASVRLSEARLKKSKAQLEFSRRDFDRVQQLADNGVGMLQELDMARASRASAEADVEVSAAEVERMNAVLEEAQLHVANTQIVSPLTGWVQARHTDPGALATPSSPILTIVDMDPAQVVVYVPEREIRLADEGRAATVTTVANESYEGVVRRVAPSLSVTTRTTEVVVEVPNPDRRLRPGMSADVMLTVQEDSDALAIPLVAVFYQQGSSFVYRIEQGVAYLVPIELGIEEKEYVQVTRGLEDGDRVVVKGQYLLEDEHPVDDGSGEREKPQGSVLDS